MITPPFLALMSKGQPPIPPTVLALRYAPSNADSAYSIDHGATWTPFASPDSSRVLAIAANSVCAVSVGGPATSWRTVDGKTWTAHAMPYFPSFWEGVCWAEELGLFCAIGFAVLYAGTQAIATSPDGITWTLQTTPAGCVGNGIAWNGSTFCAVVVDYVANDIGTLTSPDGITWTKTVVPALTFAASYNIAAGGDGVFCTLDDPGGTESSYTSPDGITWTTHVGALTGFGGGFIAWIPALSEFVAGGGEGGHTAKTSPDGITWTQSTVLAGYEVLNDAPCFDGTALFVFADDIATGLIAGVLISTDEGVTFSTFVELPGTPDVSATLIVFPS